MPTTKHDHDIPENIVWLRRRSSAARSRPSSLRSQSPFLLQKDKYQCSTAAAEDNPPHRPTPPPSRWVPSSQALTTTHSGCSGVRVGTVHFSTPQPTTLPDSPAGTLWTAIDVSKAFESRQILSFQCRRPPLRGHGWGGRQEPPQSQTGAD
jgi:hypothetical protein